MNRCQRRKISLSSICEASSSEKDNMYNYVNLATPKETIFSYEWICRLWKRSIFPILHKQLHLKLLNLLTRNQVIIPGCGSANAERDQIYQRTGLWTRNQLIFSQSLDLSTANPGEVRIACLSSAVDLIHVLSTSCGWFTDSSLRENWPCCGRAWLPYCCSWNSVSIFLFKVSSLVTRTQWLSNFT